METCLGERVWKRIVQERQEPQNAFGGITQVRLSDQELHCDPVLNLCRHDTNICTICHVKIHQHLDSTVTSVRVFENSGTSHVGYLFIFQYGVIQMIGGAKYWKHPFVNLPASRPNDVKAANKSFRKWRFRSGMVRAPQYSTMKHFPAVKTNQKNVSTWTPV